MGGEISGQSRPLTASVGRFCANFFLPSDPGPLCVSVSPLSPVDDFTIVPALNFNYFLVFFFFAPAPLVDSSFVTD